MEPIGERAVSRAKLAKEGVPAVDLRNMMQEAAGADLKWKERMANGVSYPASDDVLQVAQEAYLAFFSANALYPGIFPSMHGFEREVIDMTADLLHGERAVGSITSGGSESILLAVKSARDRAKVLRPEVSTPEMVVPDSAHPAFWKAAQYFGLRIVVVPMTKNGLVDLPAYLGAVGDDTVLMVGSAPSTPAGHGWTPSPRWRSWPSSGTSASTPTRAWGAISYPLWRSWAAMP